MVRRALIWGIAFAAMCFAVRGYQLRDPDSMLYEWIARLLEDRPLAEWIAPRFPPGWPSQQGLFFEHFAVFFWPAAALGKLGLRGALAANFLWVLLSYLLLFRLALRLYGEEAAWAAVVFYAVSPIGLQYLVRANHEPAVACAYLGALWAIAAERPVALGLFALLAVAIKGGLGLALFPVALAASRSRKTIAGLALGLALAALFCGAYELAFRHVAGRSFLAAYWDRQFGGVADQERLGAFRKLSTPLYYLARIAWFGLPGIALVAAQALRRRPLPKAALIPAAADVALLSLLSRRAVRYVFPVYSLCNLAGAQVFSEWSQGRLLRLRGGLEPALAVFLVVAAALR